MFEDLTPEQIKNDILGDVDLARIMDTREGSFTNVLVSPVAYELWKAFQGLNAVIPMFYIDETSGIYIDKVAAAYGMIRKPGLKATAAVLFTGRNGTIIPKGRVFLTADSLQFTLDNEVVITSGQVVGTLTALEEGERYNVEAGAIFRQLVNLPGLETIENTAAMGGADAENDTALVERFYDFLRNPGTSGNEAHYRQWALEVEGVGAVKVLPLWAGPGTVKVLIVGMNNQPLDQTIVNNCIDHIEENRPIGATVTVESAAGLAINVSATVILGSGITAAQVRDAFETAITAHLSDIAFSQTVVVYNRIGYMLLDIPGVIDFSTLTVNGGTTDIAINVNTVPVTGTVEVSA